MGAALPSNQAPSALNVGETTAKDAALGAELGSYIGPEGTVIGGVIGAVGGFLSGVFSGIGGGSNNVPDLDGPAKAEQQYTSNIYQQKSNNTGAGGIAGTSEGGVGTNPYAEDPSNDPYAQSDLNDTGNVSKGAYNAISNQAQANAASAYGQSQQALQQQAPTINNPYAAGSQKTLAGLQGQQGQAVDAYGRLAGSMDGNISQLQQDASGQGTTAADLAFTQATSQNVAAQQAAAASAGGGAGYSAAARGAAANSGMATQQAVGQLGQQKQAEMVSAQDQLQAAQGLQGSMYGAQAGIENSQAGQAQNEYTLQQQVAGQQAGMTQQEQAQNNTAALGWNNAAYNDQGQNLSALEGFTVANSQQGGLAVNQSAQSTAAAQGWTGAAISAASAIGGAAAGSDVRMKDGVRPMGKGDNPYSLDGGSAPDEPEAPHGVVITIGKPSGDNPYHPSGKDGGSPHPLSVTFGEVEPSVYTYKPDVQKKLGDDGREHFGVMAQDLEKTPAGKSVVLDTPHGKMIDLKGAAGLTLAGLAHHEKRLRALEGNPYDDADAE